jgi:hypothetical protein
VTCGKLSTALNRRRTTSASTEGLLEAERLRQHGGRFALAPGVVLSINLNQLDPSTAPRAIGDLAAAALTHLLKHARKDTSDAA